MPPICHRPANWRAAWRRGPGPRRPNPPLRRSQSRKPEPAATLSAERERARPPQAEAPPPEPRAASDDDPPEQEPRQAEIKSFEDVVALAEAKRDLKLKHALVEQVRLVRFKPGTIEINPLPQAPRELGQDLMRKLKAWTGRVWMVAVSDEEGAAPLGQQRREREARAIESVREHPSVKQVMQHFPGARIAAVRPVAEPAPQEPDSDAPDELKEDGTN